MFRLSGSRRVFGTALNTTGTTLPSGRRALLAATAWPSLSDGTANCVVSRIGAEPSFVSSELMQQRRFQSTTAETGVEFEVSVEKPTEAARHQDASAFWPTLVQRLHLFYTASAEARAAKANKELQQKQEGGDSRSSSSSGSSTGTLSLMSSPTSGPLPADPSVAAAVREYFVKLDAEQGAVASDDETREVAWSGLTIGESIDIVHHLLYFQVHVRENKIASYVAKWLGEHCKEMRTTDVLEVCTSASRLRFPQKWYAAVPREELLPACVGVAQSLNWAELIQLDTLLGLLGENEARTELVEVYIETLAKPSICSNNRDRVEKIAKVLPQLGRQGAPLIAHYVPQCNAEESAMLLEAMSKVRSLRAGQSELINKLCKHMARDDVVEGWTADDISRFLSFLSLFLPMPPPVLLTALEGYLGERTKTKSSSGGKKKATTGSNMKTTSFTKHEVGELLEALAVAGLAKPTATAGKKASSSSTGPDLVSLLMSNETIEAIEKGCDVHERAALSRALAVAYQPESAKRLLDSLTQEEIGSQATPADVKNILHGCVFMTYYPPPLMEWMAKRVTAIRQELNIEEASAIVYGLSQVKGIEQSLFVALARRVSTIVKFSVGRSRSVTQRNNQNLSAHCIAMLLRGFEAVHLPASTDPRLFQYLGDHIAREAVSDDLSFSVRDCASLLLVVRNLHLKHQDFVRILTSQIRAGASTLSCEDVVFVAECLSHAEARDVKIAATLASRLVNLKEEGCTEQQASRFIRILLRDKLFSVFESVDMYLLHPSVKFTGENAALMAACCARAGQPETAEELADVAAKDKAVWASEESLVNVIRSVPATKDIARKVMLALQKELTKIDAEHVGDVLSAAAGVPLHPADGWTKAAKEKFVIDLANHGASFAVDSETGLPTSNGSNCELTADSMTATLKHVADENLKVIPLYRFLGRQLVAKQSDFTADQALTCLLTYAKFTVRDDRVVRALFARCGELANSIAKNEEQKEGLKIALSVFGSAWAKKELLQKVGFEPKRPKRATKRR